jgi:recombination protein RecA
MAPASDVSHALATLQARWGTGVLRRGSEIGLMVDGALARVAAVDPEPVAGPAAELAPDRIGHMPFAPAPVPARPGVPVADEGRVVSTGFAALDAILGTGGLPRAATVALRGDASSGKTTAALRTVAEAQAGGAIAAWLDLARTFDPVEAVARGVRPEWLVVLTPADLEEALSLAAALLSGRTVDVLVLDLPDGRDPAVAGTRVGDRLGRLAALARRAGTLLVVLEPVALGRGLAAAVEEASGLRLDLRRSGWIRLGRDVVGQRSTVEVARNRFGPPGRRADVEILYAEGGARDACLRHPALLAGPAAPLAPPGGVGPVPVLAVMGPPSTHARLKGPPASTESHAPAASSLAPPSPPPGEGTGGGRRRHLRLVAGRPDHPRRPTLGGRDRGGRGSARPVARRAPGDAARGRPPAGPRGDVPRSPA